MDLKFTPIYTLGIWNITGKTYIWKEQIKNLEGALWNPYLKVWHIPFSTDITSLKNAVVKKEVDICTRLFLESEKIEG
jgi:hypothetical protein